MCLLTLCHIILGKPQVIGSKKIYWVCIFSFPKEGTSGVTILFCPPAKPCHSVVVNGPSYRDTDEGARNSIHSETKITPLLFPKSTSEYIR